MILDNVASAIVIPESGMSKVLLVQANGARVMGFGFAAGYTLKEHTSPGDVLLQFLDGEVDVTIEGHTSEVRAGSLVHIKAGVPHSVYARTPMRMLLVLLQA